MLQTIVSGGQTGADQGALEAAFHCGVRIKGYAPRGYVTETGPNELLRTRYGLIEADGGYLQRTLANVLSSDGTLIVCRALSGGALQTYNYCLENDKPVRVFSMLTPMGNTLYPLALNTQVQKIQAWLVEHDIMVLNVAGNRESKVKGIQAYTRELMTRVLNQASTL